MRLGYASKCTLSATGADFWVPAILVGKACAILILPGRASFWILLRRKGE